VDFIAGYQWDLLGGWAAFVNASLPFPPAQLATDDFAGPAPNNTNLVVKGIVALGAWAQLLDARGAAAQAAEVRGWAATHAATLVALATDTAGAPPLPRLRRQYQLPPGSSWSLKYNALFEYVLNTGVLKEACPLNLAPTASTTAQMAMGDALAVALLDARGFKAEDFARSHPGGSLGRRLLTHVSDVMRSGNEVPSVLPTASFSDLMREMSAKGLGASAIVDANQQVLGIFTDGDLRRLIETGTDMRQLTAQQVMHANPRTVRASALAAEAAELMELFRITSVLVVDEQGTLSGAINTNDLMRAKVI
jgi:KpsF/GutQ family protein